MFGPKGKVSSADIVKVRIPVGRRTVERDMHVRTTEIGHSHALDYVFVESLERRESDFSSYSFSSLLPPNPNLMCRCEGV